MTEKRFIMDNDGDITEFDYKQNEYIQDFMFANGKSWDKICNRLNEPIYDAFGKVSTIDEALNKVKEHGYSHYFDDTYTNLVCISRLKNKQGINCTDACQYEENEELKTELKHLRKKYNAFFRSR